ncbi:LysR family transcriptional regulator [Mesorhizobium sp. CO1-1-4]|uniref:LysR substrate-binding domain-containing protein n=1 Tax=Mesorhizobium sp. CO1-1-4 TaxID=2876633 RepID=UPI001CCA2AF1|nr:LysR family transcriptional regulator [Mesorhizobium sp. CO1-1-4]MBZ9738328.1 LysR family transcriptional regulator [Mesorhizobium sp. CO1-1-4]
MPDLSLDLRYLRYALASAEHGSFRRAAIVLGVSQSTVSRRVLLLEHRLGFELFERDRRGARLTQAGRNFLNEAAVGVDHLNRAVLLGRSDYRGERGEIRIGILPSLPSGLFHVVLKTFREEHRDVRVTLHEGSHRTNLHKLTTGLLDVCFVTGVPGVSGYETEHLWDERVYVVLPEYHRLATLESISWNDLRDEVFIVSDRQPGPEIRDFLIKRLLDCRERPEILVHDVGRESLLNLVAIGYGLTLVSASSHSVAAAGVVLRPIEGEAEVLPSSAIWSTGNNNPTLDRLLSLAKTIRVALRRPLRS